MHDQRSPVPADEDDRIDHAVLSMLLDVDAQPLWSVDEVAREVGDRIATTDSLARLYGAGLIHRLGEFVFATRPALLGARLVQ